MEFFIIQAGIRGMTVKKTLVACFNQKMTIKNHQQ